MIGEDDKGENKKMPKKIHPKKLAVGPALVGTFSFIRHHKLDFLKISFLPMVFFFFSLMIQSILQRPPIYSFQSATLFFTHDITLLNLGFYLLSLLFSVIAVFMLAIADFRYILLGEYQAGEWFQMAWKKCHWRLLGYYILYKFLLMGILAFIFLGIAVILLLSGLELSPETLSEVHHIVMVKIKTGSLIMIALVAYGLMGLLFFIYCALRLMLFAPVAALDGQKPLRSSWHALKGI